ncbi:putative cytochrome P450 hydroxylase [[Actinomadura] parvosata subsp. kistnae]|uniref:Cytochrome n=1 Tax=[Actinomadura] parvosata subsp. kistnae TaxID=1909395 RepID=A0A1V0A365_9ACTN|nr:cytochrome P450 [Nonomuraea sp. ATCC 55076]AQZ64637.1 cytochrome [Nonomuraea sp. ATCC 55076]SPL99523.1 putative cytochrome P450 hydroxylase [Actinomadura parvosata subsp. kistnae]
MNVLKQILDPAARPDPYRYFGALRESPVTVQEDGTYLVSTYREIVALLHDPRVSSDRRNLSAGAPAEQDDFNPSFIGLDSPEHDRLRGLAMRHFGPPHSPETVERLRPKMLELTTALIDALKGRTRADIVDEVAYPLPVAVICALLGVPEEDEPRFHALADEVVETLGPGEEDRAERERARKAAAMELSRYLAGLAEARERAPRADMLSGLITYRGPAGGMTRDEAVATSVLLLIAGHETTINLIANGMLTFLRRPDLLRRLRDDPELIIPAVEELLRFEPPVQFVSSRVALDDITIAGTTIPAGAPIVLAMAAGSRDPAHVDRPDEFDVDRPRNEHLGFGGGVHYCFGAPLARLEAQIVLKELVRRLRGPRLVADPPPYRPSAVLRGPRHLVVEYDGID